MAQVEGTALKYPREGWMNQTLGPAQASRRWHCRNVMQCLACARCRRDVATSAMSQDEGSVTKQQARRVHLPHLPGADDPAVRCPPWSVVVGTGDAMTATSGSAAASPVPVAPPWFAGPG